MFNKRFFGNMTRAGFGPGISKAKLSQIMLEILLQLPKGTKNLKDNIVYNMGLTGQMSTTRDINEAWTQTKKKAAKLYPEEFILDNRNALNWNDSSKKILDKNISLANYKKLNKLAENENCNVNQLVSKIIKYYEKNKL
jgi:hypothetical protein